MSRRGCSAPAGPEVHAGTVHCDTARAPKEAEERESFWAGHRHLQCISVCSPLRGFTLGAGVSRMLKSPAGRQKTLNLNKSQELY